MASCVPAGPSANCIVNDDDDDRATTLLPVVASAPPRQAPLPLLVASRAARRVASDDTQRPFMSSDDRKNLAESLSCCCCCCCCAGAASSPAAVAAGCDEICRAEQPALLTVAAQVKRGTPLRNVPRRLRNMLRSIGERQWIKLAMFLVAGRSFAHDGDTSHVLISHASNTARTTITRRRKAAKVPLDLDAEVQKRVVTSREAAKNTRDIGGYAARRVFVLGCLKVCWILLLHERGWARVRADVMQICARVFRTT